MLNGTFWYKDNVLLLNKHTNLWLSKDTTGNICFIFRLAYTYTLSCNLFYLCVCTVLVFGTPFFFNMSRVQYVFPEYVLLCMLYLVLLQQSIVLCWPWFAFCYIRNGGIIGQNKILSLSEHLAWISPVKASIFTQT